MKPVYKVSEKLNNIFLLLKLLGTYNLFRYKHIVDNSELKEACPFALKCRKLIDTDTERERILTILYSLKEVLDETIEIMEKIDKVMDDTDSD